jgi:hypothetical protein
MGGTCCSPATYYPQPGVAYLLCGGIYPKSGACQEAGGMPAFDLGADVHENVAALRRARGRRVSITPMRSSFHGGRDEVGIVPWAAGGPVTMAGRQGEPRVRRGGNKP